MEIASIIISLLALAFGIYTYFAHDKRLKEQQALLNALSIEKLKRESQEQGKADVRVSLTMDREPDNFSMRSFYEASGTVKVTNFGKATARNIRIRQNGYSRLFDYDIAQLAPNESREYHETWERGKLRNVTVIARWNDEFAENRSSTIQL